jgi:NADPH-ferrihemoprotein reductase
MSRLCLCIAVWQASDAGSPAAATLYFGCRRPDEDYLYDQDWQELASAGALQTLRVAFSRQQADVKVYVQHLMKEDAGAIAAVMAAGGHVYVCGDGAQMAKDVHATLLGVLRDERGLTEVEAAEELSAMAKAGRYVRDIWS